MLSADRIIKASALVISSGCKLICVTPISEFVTKVVEYAGGGLPNGNSRLLFRE